MTDETAAELRARLAKRSHGATMPFFISKEEGIAIDGMLARLAAAEADADQLAAVLGWRGARAPRPGEVHTCSLGSCWRCALHSHDKALALRDPS